MKKYLGHLALIPLVILALTPPSDFQLDCTVNSTFWLWMTFFSGFFAFLFLYQKVSTWLKLLVIWCFVSCFLSRAPFMSFTMFWSVIVCAYYYLLCTKIENWEPVKKVIQSIIFFIVLLMVMQLLGKDTLLNFNQKTPLVLGTIGNKMILSSFVCILAPFLLFNPLNWVILIIISFITWSSGAVLSIFAGLGTLAWIKFKKWRLVFLTIAIVLPICYAVQTRDITTFQSPAGRRLVWIETAQLSIKHPLGYGIGTYKILYPVLCSRTVTKQAPGREWNTAHNDWLQMTWELGFPGMILLIGWLVSIARKVKNPIKLAGLAIIATNMVIHFPTHMVQGAFLILMFLAFCSQGEKNGFNDQTSNC